MASWFSSVLGGSFGETVAPPAVQDKQVEAAQGSNVGSAIGFSDRMTYWTSMAKEMGSSFAKDSGFALVDRAESGSYTPVGDASKELSEIEANCKSIITGVAEPTTIWNRWTKRMDASPLERFYDRQAHEDLSLKTIILRSSALDVAVSTVLRKPSYASDTNNSLLEFLDRILVGSRETKQEILSAVVRLAENVDGTAARDKIEALVTRALSEAKCDHRYEDALRETNDWLQHVTSKEKELRALCTYGNAAGTDAASGGAAAQDDADAYRDQLLEELVVGPEVGDEELRERVARSSELLDCNASLRHLVSIGGAVLAERAGRESVSTHALQEITTIRDVVMQQIESANSRMQGATSERKLVAQESAATEQRLSKAEAALNERLERLMSKRRELEAELEMVLGEVMSCDQQLKDVRRDLDMLPRTTQGKDKNLADQLQALQVQVQDYENEMDALEEAAFFIQTACASVSVSVAQQCDFMAQTRAHVLAEEQRLMLIHLKHQNAQLQLLRDSLLFCTEELGMSATKTSKISKLGMPELVTEEGNRVSMLHQRKREASARVLAIGQDVEDLRIRANQLWQTLGGGERSSSRTTPSDSMAANKEQHPHRDLPEEQPAHRSPSLPNTSAGAGAGAGSDEGGSGGGGGAAGADEASRGLDGSALSISISGEGKMLGQVSALLSQLDTHLTAIVSAYELKDDPLLLEPCEPSKEYEATRGALVSPAARTLAPPQFSPLPPRPPVVQELASTQIAAAARGVEVRSSRGADEREQALLPPPGNNAHL